MKGWASRPRSKHHVACFALATLLAGVASSRWAAAGWAAEAAKRAADTIERKASPEPSASAQPKARGDSHAAKKPHAEKAIARIGDETITLADVQPDIAFQVYRQRVDIYTLLVRAVNDLVERRLLEREAKRRDISVEELSRLLAAEAEPATAADIDAYLAKNPGAANEPGARERVAHYLTEQRRIQARLDFVDALRDQAHFEMVLVPPEQPRVRVDTEGAPARGPRDAPLTLVHFASFSSERAAGSVDLIRRLESELPGRIRWIHRSLPRDHDELGLAAAQLAAAAQEKGKFWELHDRLFERRGSFKPADLDRLGAELGIPKVRPGDTAYIDVVKRDIDEARRIGIEEETVIFVNGRYFSPTFPYSQLRALVADELGEATTSSALQSSPPASAPTRN